MTQPTLIWFKRAGRMRRGQGHVIETRDGMTKVQPTAKGRRWVWLTAGEVAEGSRQEQGSLKLGGQKTKRTTDAANVTRCLEGSVSGRRQGNSVRQA